jgi:uracil-DNA glycosylase
MDIDITQVIREMCHTDWQHMLVECIDPFKESINALLKKEHDAGNEVFPAVNNIFKAFSMFDRRDLKVVILGQDAYHNKSKTGIPFANGMCFSVPQECGKCPPSLVTIFKEIEHEYGIKRTNTDLEDWATQGVLLLNCALTVKSGQPNSHMKVWKPFTEALVKRIAAEQEGIVYILWGEFAKSYVQIANIDESDKKNLVLTARHPSPLAMSKGSFVGNMHFKQANEYLERQGKIVIQWI